jgi:hypothetical protein
MRYGIEQLFGSIKQKIGSSFKLLREDLSRKASIACAILWNFWVFATYLFLLFLSGILQYSYAKGCGRFSEQSQRMFVKRFFIFFPPDSENLEFLYCIFAGLPNVDSERFKFFIHNVFPLSALEVILFLKVLRLVARICLCFRVEIQSSQIGFRAALVFRVGGKRPLERTNPLLS